MNPLAQLLLAAAALHVALTASLPESGSKLIADLKPELERPLEKEAVQVAVVEQTSVVEDVKNELLAKPEDIPVAVVIENSRPAIKTNEVDDDNEIRRPPVDLKNPGPPQHQEHENQNADYFPSAQEKLLTVRDTILQTQNVLRQGIQGVGDDISKWLSTNEQMNTVQQSIQSLRNTFTLQIQKLNEITKGLSTPQALKTEDIPGQEQVQTQPDLKEVETRIKILENNFNNGVRAISEGVNIAAILREEDGNSEVATSAPSQPATPPPTSGSLGDMAGNMFTAFQNTVSNSLSNIFQSMTSFIGFSPSTLPPGVQADTPQSTTGRPGSSWLPNLFNRTQEGVQNPGLVISAFQNFQNYSQNILNTLGLNNNVPQNSVVVKQPEAPAEAAPLAPAVTPLAPAAAPPAPAASTGPIREILANNPVVQSIAGTVQRIQSAITNPEGPRDTEKSDDLQTKGGYGGYRPGASGDSDTSSSGLKQSLGPIKEDFSEETKKPDVEKESAEVSEKTE